MSVNPLFAPRKAKKLPAEPEPSEIGGTALGNDFYVKYSEKAIKEILSVRHSASDYNIFKLYKEHDKMENEEYWKMPGGFSATPCKDLERELLEEINLDFTPKTFTKGEETYTSHESDLSSMRIKMIQDGLVDATKLMALDPVGF